jgi:hypothetical protein
MKRLAYPLMLVFFSLLAAAIFTAVTATTLASYASSEKGMAKSNKGSATTAVVLAGK